MRGENMTKVFCDICGAEKDNNLQICKKKMTEKFFSVVFL